MIRSLVVAVLLFGCVAAAAQTPRSLRTSIQVISEDASFNSEVSSLSLRELRTIPDVVVSEEADYILIVMTETINAGRNFVLTAMMIHRLPCPGDTPATKNDRCDVLEQIQTMSILPKERLREKITSLVANFDTGLLEPARRRRLPARTIK